MELLGIPFASLCLEGALGSPLWVLCAEQLTGGGGPPGLLPEGVGLDIRGATPTLDSSGVYHYEAPLVNRPHMAQMAHLWGH